MKKNLILLDIDDTVVDWINPFSEFMDRLGIESIKPYGSLAERYNMPEERIRVYVEYFNRSDEFGSLPFIDGTVEVIKKWSENYTVVGVSCCGTSEDTKQKREANLSNIFGVGGIATLPLYSSKEILLEFYKDNVALFIDDAKFHVESGHKLSINTLHYTKKEHKHNTFKHWNELYDYSP